MALQQPQALDDHRSFQKLFVSLLTRTLDDLLVPSQRTRALYFLQVELADPTSLWHHWLDDIGIDRKMLDHVIQRQLTQRRGRGRSIVPWSLKVQRQDD